MESDKKDSYSNANLFSESYFVETDLKSLADTIDATMLLIDNIEHREIIIKHLHIENVRSLIFELIDKYKEIYEVNLQKVWLNNLIRKVKENLQLRTSTIPPTELDFL